MLMRASKVSDRSNVIPRSVCVISEGAVRRPSISRLISVVHLRAGEPKIIISGRVSH